MAEGFILSSMKLQYRHVESALVRLFGVDNSHIGAFKARIRHLRNLGVPHIVKPGSGDRVEYTRVNVAEMALALELERFGKPPREAAWMAAHFARAPEFLASRRAPRYLVLLPARLDARPIGDANGTSSYIEFPNGGIAYLADGQEIRPLLKKCSSFGIINLSMFLSDLAQQVEGNAQSHAFVN
jgi:hypothetical protein